MRKLKDGDGNYIWPPAAQAGGRATLMNFPVAEAEDMPDIGADTLRRSPSATSGAAI